MSNITATYSDTEEDFGDPFANLGKSKYVKKPYLRDNKIAFNVIDIAGPVQGKFDDEFILTIEYVDHMTGDATVGAFNFPYLNAKKEVGPRTEALMKMQQGLSLGYKYDSYYLAGSGPGFIMSKTPSK